MLRTPRIHFQVWKGRYCY